MRVVWTSGRPPERFYLSGSRLDGLKPDGFFPRETPDESPPVSMRSSDSLRIYSSSLRSTNVFFPFWFHSLSPRTFTFRGENVHWVYDLPPVYDVKVSRTPTPSAPGGTEVPTELIQVADMGKRVAGQGEADRRVDRIVRHLKKGYAYTLDPGDVPPGRDGIEWFVFTSKKGSCEHFAAALAAMIRGCGIPARVVTGFLVTEYNATGDYFIVRVSDAHAWVEYWDGTWRTVDATPSARTVPFLRFHLIDELRFRWIRWVIQYSLDDQIRIARGIFSAGPHVARQMENQWHFAVYFLCSAAVVWGGSSFSGSGLRSPYEKSAGASEKGSQACPLSSHEITSRCFKAVPSLEPEFRTFSRHTSLEFAEGMRTWTPHQADGQGHLGRTQAWRQSRGGGRAVSGGVLDLRAGSSHFLPRSSRRRWVWFRLAMRRRALLLMPYSRAVRTEIALAAAGPMGGVVLERCLTGGGRRVPGDVHREGLDSPSPVHPFSAGPFPLGMSSAECDGTGPAGDDVLHLVSAFRCRPGRSCDPP
jgi:hypothetical protein